MVGRELAARIVRAVFGFRDLLGVLEPMQTTLIELAH
jgi:hypothetical protein